MKATSRGKYLSRSGDEQPSDDIRLLFPFYRLLTVLTCRACACLQAFLQIQLSIKTVVIPAALPATLPVPFVLTALLSPLTIQVGPYY